MSDFSRIPAEVRQLNQWVCIRAGSKVPMRAFENDAASSSNSSSWASFDNAVRAVELGHYDNIGFVFHNNGIVGIDIDCGYEENGLLSQTAAEILGRCHSYTERSSSGRGFHILVKGKLPFDGKNNQHGVEIYQTGRYFITTGDMVVFPYLIENQPAIDAIVERFFQETRTEHDKPLMNVRIYNPEWELPKDGRVKLRPVYPRIPAGSRNICLTSLAGMLHNQGYSKGQIYDELLYANAVACDPCLDKRELRTIVNSVSRYKR